MDEVGLRFALGELPPSTTECSGREKGLPLVCRCGYSASFHLRKIALIGLFLLVLNGTIASSLDVFSLFLFLLSEFLMLIKLL
jgi:hypothetical protein